ncbi:hypothetical protein DICPUDRAFT_56024 [Dictyostelium purpureum]|uniref:Magnesium transporter n=1 Tax=Dictyostelium purpureum TaxID=5786 RepID=F0ZPH9_DICPU|nr:uncharacterized protein DICPUDRAFT_56024 [Dictyostelium purpureum]EGC34161.1 hypothetical protein DICPUDRAFT_56024 [Dictyostelium purpureum]|eukprot:XP_003289315.1 hypothetical protein DICPUDRAFT_56024 [Dictyostelium purpureum]
MNNILKLYNNNSYSHKSLIRVNGLIKGHGNLNFKRNFSKHNLAAPFLSTQEQNESNIKNNNNNGTNNSINNNSSKPDRVGIGKENFNLINKTTTTTSTQTKIYDEENFTNFNSNSNSNGNINNNNNLTSNFGTDGLKSFKVITLDINGNPEERRIYKGDLSSELKLQARDLRTIDPSFPPQMPSILVRDKVVLISIGAVRAIIQYNRVMLFETQNESLRDEVIVNIKDAVQSNYEYLPLPFEFRVFESILDLVCRKLDLEFRRMQSLIEKELQLLNENPEHNLEELLLYHKKGLNQFEVKIKEIIDAITDVLQSDEDMALMYLSFRHATGGARRKNQHDEIEILLETYTRQLEQMSSNISQLKETLNSTEEFVNFQLDTARNKIMSIQLMLSILTISTGLGGVVTGTFGMNLVSGLEHSPYAFATACGAIGCIGFLTFAGLRKYCQVKNILPYTKKTPNHLKLGLGFRNDSFINPLRDNVLLKEQSQQILKDQQNAIGQLQPQITNDQPQQLLKDYKGHPQSQTQYETEFNREFKDANILFENPQNQKDPRVKITQKLNKIQQDRIQRQHTQQPI